MLNLKRAKENEIRLIQKLRAAESNLKRAEKRRKDAERKLDTRRKIVLGAALLAAVETERIQVGVIRGLVASFVADRDKVLFESGPFATPRNLGSGATLAVTDTQE